MNCVFCEIVAGKSKAEILFEDENVISFLDVRPMNFGHTLVIPKKHYETFLEIPTDELLLLVKAVHTISEGIIESLNPDGYNLVSNNGLAAGQSVFHFHFHIIPRNNDDGFKPKINFKFYEDGTMKMYGDKIRLAVNNRRNKNG